MAGVTKRIDQGRGHWYKLDGRKVDGVTSVISNGVPKPALPPWAAREVATFAADNLELLGHLERDARIDLLKGSPYRDRDKAARRGTEVHGLAERIINGEEVDAPEELIGHVDSYMQFLEDFDVQPILVERTVGHRAHQWMGTLDLVADLNDGLRWILDVKTTRSGIYGETALQISAYRNAEFYLDDNGKEQPMLKVQRAGAIWVRADGYDLVPVDASPAIYRTFRFAQQIARFQTDTSKTVIGDVIQPPKDLAS